MSEREFLAVGNLSWIYLVHMSVKTKIVGVIPHTIPRGPIIKSLPFILEDDKVQISKVQLQNLAI